MSEPSERMSTYLTRRLAVIISVTVCSVVGMSIVLLSLVPASFDRVYDVAHVKVAEDENAVLHTARSLTEGMQQVAGHFDLEVDRSLISIDEVTYQPDKIIGRFHNASEYPVYRVKLSIIVRDSEGGLKDVLSERAKGFGSLEPGGDGYFYVEWDQEDYEENDDISLRVTEASKSFLRLNAP